MEKENFDNATLDIVNKAIRKAINGGLEYIPQLNFRPGRIEYMIKGDDSILDDNSQRYIEVVGLQISKEMFRQYVKACKRLNKLPTLDNLVKTSLLISFIGNIVRTEQTDIAFQFGVWGQFKNEQGKFQRFQSKRFLFRYVKRTQPQNNYFFTAKEKYPDGLTEDMIAEMIEHGAVFNVIGVEDNIHVHFGANDLVDFCINYM